MRELREDNSGFVQFPFMEPGLKRTIDKTLVYIVAFDEDSDYILSNTILNLPGEYVTEDITGRCTKLKSDSEIEGDIIIDKDDLTSFPLVSVVCIGWSNNSLIREDGEFWFATFRDLTNEGRKLYYSMKKLNNNKEVRILTFNGVK